MFNIFRKKHEIFPEAIIASNWWASKLLEPTVRCVTVFKRKAFLLKKV